MALGCLALALVVGTLFFDDPHASYPDFLAWLEYHALVVTVVALLSRLGALLLRRSGLARAGVVVALFPAIFVVAGTIYTFIPARG